jgi:hypothetical protein
LDKISLKKDVYDTEKYFNTLIKNEMAKPQSRDRDRAIEVLKESQTREKNLAKLSKESGGAN